MTETPPGTGDLPTLRHEYDTHGVAVPELDPDPLVQFGVWFEEAAAEGIYEPHAVALSTVDADGRPSCRYVLLRGVDERGFRFFTNYRSAKGRDLDARGRAALTWGWLELHRSIRATGAVRRDGVMAQVDLACGPNRVVSVMSREAADQLGLKPGDTATAVIKATTVVVERA